MFVIRHNKVKGLNGDVDDDLHTFIEWITEMWQRNAWNNDWTARNTI